MLTETGPSWQIISQVRSVNSSGSGFSLHLQSGSDEEVRGRPETHR
jgi:hypothetical protein